MQLSRAQAIACALIVVAVVALALALWARSRSSRLAVGAWRLGLSQAVSSYSFWIVLGISAAAYVRGLSVIWIAAGILAGAILNGFYVGPRLVGLFARSSARSALATVLSASGAGTDPAATGGAAAIVFLFLLIGLIAQLRVAGAIVATGLDVVPWMGIASVAALGFLPALIGGRRAAIDVSVLCALLVPAIAVFLAFPAFMFATGTGGVIRGLESIDPAVSTWLGPRLSSAIGGVALGFTLVGQPAVLDQFRAARNADAARQAGLLTCLWFALVLGAMVLFGWSALVLYSSVDDPNLVLIDATSRLLPPSLQSLPVMAIALAAAAAIGHQLVTLGEIGAAAWPSEKTPGIGSQRARILAWIAAASSALVAATTNFGSIRLYVLTLICVGAALGPTLLARLGVGEVRPAVSAIAIRIGLVSALVLLLVRNEVANSLAVLVSFLLALGVAFTGRTRRLPD
jgi:Na+/proline symporter